MTKAAAAGVAAAVALGVYVRWVRPRAFSWGATGEEAGRPMAGDELCPRPQLNATRAVPSSLCENTALPVPTS